MTNELALGIDLGGTKILAGVVRTDGRVLGEAKLPTEADKDAETILNNMLSAARQALAIAGAAGYLHGRPHPAQQPPLAAWLPHRGTRHRSTRAARRPQQ